MADRRPGWWPFGDGHEEERLSALLDDELPEAEALEVTRHVADCGSCLADLETIREARRAVRDLPDVQPPEDLYGDVLARPSDAAALRAGSGVRLLAAAAASAVLLALTAFVAGSEEAGTVSPPVEVFVVDHVSRMEGGPVLTPVDLGR